LKFRGQESVARSERREKWNLQTTSGGGRRRESRNNKEAWGKGDRFNRWKRVREIIEKRLEIAGRGEKKKIMIGKKEKGQRAGDSKPNRRNGKASYFKRGRGGDHKMRRVDRTPIDPDQEK